MAGAAREITDPVEAAKHGIGSSKRLIAATLDDLSDHHSWLETYHRDERLRAERLRRRELRQRLERRYQRTVGATRHAARKSYVTGRGIARFSKRHARVFARWAAPRLRLLARYASETATALWQWSRQHASVFSRRAYDAVSDGFNRSVLASEQAGNAFRRHASEFSTRTVTELLSNTAPLRRRAECEWARARLRAKRTRERAEQHSADWIATSPTLAQLRTKLHRGTIRGLQRGAPLVRRAQATAIRLEADISARIIRAVPEFRRLLRAHMPSAAPPVKTAIKRTGRALILRPTSALACVAPAGDRLPALYRV